MQPEYYVHEPHPFLLRFSETIGIRYYGLAYVLGFVVAAVLLHLYWKRGRSPVPPAAQSDLLFWIIVGTLVGGRLGSFLFYAPGDLVRDPLAFFRVWDGGMASHGGFLGVLAGVWWASRRARLPFLAVGDVVCTLAPPGILFGRIANFLNGELWGKVTDVPWAVIFTTSAPPGTPAILIEPRHPSQLYAAALEGLVLLLYSQWRIWRTDVVRTQPGRLAGEFLAGYAIVRIVGEFFRQNDPGIEPVLGLNRGAWLSLGLLVAGIALAVSATQRAARRKPSR
ncbi:prolipoprotein diacylglyceryl transferase [Opitutales bacterium ASA1]|uniref:prolipoprotein diacylglyceryl transferase n=1 Tax=Congregicoccus parvus TaxID=3081749 RepID=UPI002B2940B6|nr:prolipoprotein diacylglyceryl transferase [Opitutales bacterium ASA1]